VFNEPADEAKRDFTFTVSPRADLWMGIGRTWVISSLREDLVWYDTYSTERAANSRVSLGWTVPLTRVAFGISGSYVAAHDRPGFEIDTRADRREVAFRGGAEVRALSRTLVAVTAARERVEFAGDEQFRGSSLDAELTRTISSGSIALRHELTPLTSMSFDVRRDQDRFDVSTLRDSDSTSAGVQVTFDPSALIAGSARVAYRRFEPRAADLPKFTGATVAVNLTYTLLGSTRFGVQATRDLQYSYDENQPYYLQSGAAGSIAQQIYGPVDAVFRAARYTLAYRDRDGAPIPFADRVDKMRSYGAGVGYHIGRDLRIGVNVDKQRRDSELPLHSYEGLRFGTSITYGL
jgi:hypothetical protein